jgi:hypothetical protein
MNSSECRTEIVWHCKQDKLLESIFYSVNQIKITYKEAHWKRLSKKKVRCGGECTTLRVFLLQPLFDVEGWMRNPHPLLFADVVTDEEDEKLIGVTIRAEYY